MKLRSAERWWVKECEMKWRRAHPGSRAPMGLRSAYPRGGAPKQGGVTSMEYIIGVPVGIKELPSRAEECQ